MLELGRDLLLAVFAGLPLHLGHHSQGEHVAQVVVVGHGVVGVNAVLADVAQGKVDRVGTLAKEPVFDIKSK